jgi:hypothetical protein
MTETVRRLRALDEMRLDCEPYQVEPKGFTVVVEVERLLRVQQFPQGAADRGEQAAQWVDAASALLLPFSPHLPETEMARGPRETSSKARNAGTARGGGKAKAQRGAQKRSAAKGAAAGTKASAATGTRKGARKRSASKVQKRRPSEQPQSWSGVVASLVTSAMGRALLADVLEAAAAALRKERPGFEQAGTDQLASAGEAATSAGSEIVSGTAALAQRAVSALTHAAADAALNALDSVAADDRKT